MGGLNTANAPIPSLVSFPTPPMVCQAGQCHNERLILIKCDLARACVSPHAAFVDGDAFAGEIRQACMDKATVSKEARALDREEAT